MITLKRTLWWLSLSWALFYCQFRGLHKPSPVWYGCDQCGLGLIDEFNMPDWMK